MEAVAKLNNYPTSPRKMRLLADLIRGMEVDKALGVLQYNPKHPATPLYKLLKSAINNWEQKNSDEKVEDAGLIVKTIMVDGGRVIKRMRPAPQGRGYRVRKRSNHVTIIVDSVNKKINDGSGDTARKEAVVPEAAVSEPVAPVDGVVEKVEKEVKTEKPEKAVAKKSDKEKAAPKKVGEKKVAPKKAEEKKAEEKKKQASTDKKTKK